MARPSKMTDKALRDRLKDVKLVNLFESLMGIPFVTSEAVADILKIEKDTLVRWIKKSYGVNFADLREAKRETLKLKLAGKQFEMALNGSVPMAIWLGKQYLGQSDKLEHKADAEAPLVISYVPKSERK